MASWNDCCKDVVQSCPCRAVQLLYADRYTEADLYLPAFKEAPKAVIVRGVGGNIGSPQSDKMRSHRRSLEATEARLDGA